MTTGEKRPTSSNPGMRGSLDGGVWAREGAGGAGETTLRKTVSTPLPPPAPPASFGFGRHAYRLRSAPSSFSSLLRATWPSTVRLLPSPPDATCPPSLLHGPTVQFQLQTDVRSAPWSLRWIETLRRRLSGFSARSSVVLLVPGFPAGYLCKTSPDWVIAPRFACTIMDRKTKTSSLRVPSQLVGGPPGPRFPHRLSV